MSTRNYILEHSRGTAHLLYIWNCLQLFLHRILTVLGASVGVVTTMIHSQEWSLYTGSTFLRLETTLQWAALCMNSSIKKKLYGLSPRANYTDRATAACRRSDCQILRIEGATWSVWRIPRPYSWFSRKEPLLFYQVAPQLYSRGWVDPVLRKSGSAGNRTRASGSVAKNSDH
jgi:hypothetical protein